MQSTQFKKIIFGLMASLCLSASAAYAANNNNENLEVTPIQDITEQELAAIYVLSELCPKLVTEPNQFDIGYKKFVKEYMPSEADPIDTLKKRSTDPKFAKILEEAQNDAKNAGDSKNKEICEELAAYGK